MNPRKLVIFSGGDRVGKTTLISAMQEYLGEENCEVVHLSEPPGDQDNIFDINRECISKWVSTGKEWLLFDRCYVCSYILEQFRRNNNGHLDDMIDLELELLGCSDTFQVVHVSVDRPWQFAAPHHLTELRELFPNAAPWRIRDEYVARMKEHREYYSKLYDFYEHVTAFPSILHMGDAYEDTDLEVEGLLKRINHELSQ
jgi:hypothetical protein